MTDSIWSKYHENLLKRWAETCKTYSIMHSLCAQYYNKWNKRLGVPIVVLGAVTASSIFSGNENESLIWRYINGSLALVVTALSGVNNFIGTMEKTTKHQNASFKYTKIALDIDTILSFARDARHQTPQQFINSKKTEMLEIRENVPEVLSWVLANYLKKFDKSLIQTKSQVNKLEVQAPPVETESSIYSPTNRSSHSEPIKNKRNSIDLSKLIEEDSSSLYEPHNRKTTRKSNHGQILSDFTDKKTNNVHEITKKLQKMYPESDPEQNNSGMSSDEEKQIKRKSI